MMYITSASTTSSIVISSYVPFSMKFLFFFFLMIRRPPRFTLFPYTTLSRSCLRFQVRPSFLSRQRERIQREYECADLIRVMSDVARLTFLGGGFSPERVVVTQPPIA